MNNTTVTLKALMNCRLDPGSKPVCGSFIPSNRRRGRLLSNAFILLGLAAFLLPAYGQLSLNLGGRLSTPLGTLPVSSITDSVTLTGGYTAAGTTTTGLNIPIRRFQYSMIDNTGQSISSFTISYDASLALLIVAAAQPTAYRDSSGNNVFVGGAALVTFFNAGFGTYTYNTSAKWIIDYEQDHLTFTAVNSSVLPDGAGVGALLSSGTAVSTIAFSLDVDKSLVSGTVASSATAGASQFTGNVLGPVMVPEPSVVGLLGLGLAASLLCAGADRWHNKEQLRENKLAPIENGV